MTLILYIREGLQKIYSRYYLQVTIALKFLLGLLVFSTINTNLGFMERLDSTVVVMGLAALSSFLPPMVMVLSAIGLIAAHLYALSVLVMAFTMLVFIILYIFYFRFVPGKTWPILLVPMAFFFEIPLVIPMFFGLLGTPLFIVPAIAGTIVFYLLHYVVTTETVYTVEGVQEMMDTTIEFIHSVVSNQEQWLIAFVMGVGVLIIYALRTRSFDYSWKVAIATGIVWLFAGIHLGSAFFEMPSPIENLVGNLILTILVGIVLEFLFFRVDYTKTEYLQFDDNDYYYYVKAIPKRFSEEWTMKQEATRRREEREREERRRERRTGLMGGETPPSPKEEPEGRKRPLRSLPPLTKKREEQTEEQLDKTIAIDANGVKAKVGETGNHKVLGNPPGGAFLPEQSQEPKQPLENKKKNRAARRK